MGAEPFVLAGDISSPPAIPGRAGWSWFTGSAGVMYLTILNHMLGINITGSLIEINPSLPTAWNNISVNFKYKKSSYSLKLVRDPDISSVSISGSDRLIVQNQIKLIDEDNVFTFEINFPNSEKVQ